MYERLNMFTQESTCGERYPLTALQHNSIPRPNRRRNFLAEEDKWSIPCSGQPR